MFKFGTAMPFIVMSAYIPEASDTINQERHQQLKWILNSGSYQYKEVEGCYKDTKELALLVHVQSPTDLDSLIMTAGNFLQESVLLVGSDKQASLLYLEDSSTVQLGILREVSPDEAGESYMIDPQTGKYWRA